MPSIGLVGCGKWGRLILRDLLSLGATVSVVASGESASHAAGAGASAVVADLGHLPSVEGIVVASPTPTHASVIEALLPRGVPIYCEKPLCDDAAEARRLATAAPDRLFVMDKWRYHCGVLEMAAIARSGELGPLIGLRTTRIQYSHPYANTDCVWTLLPHDICIAAEIFGRLLPPRWAVADRTDRMLFGLQALSSDETGLWHVAEISVRAPRYQREITLLCRDGAAILQDGYADHLLIVENPPADGVATQPRTAKRAIATDLPLRAELAAFVEHVTGGPPPKSTAAEAADAVETIAAIRTLAGI
jgi:predicted dehydrogenase